MANPLNVFKGCYPGLSFETNPNIGKEMSIRDELLKNNWSIETLRPWLENGKSVVVIDGKKVESKIKALSTKQEMIDIDRNALMAAKPRLRVTGLLFSYGKGLLRCPLEGALKKRVFEYKEELVKPTDTEGQPTHGLVGLPLPITYSSKWRPDPAETMDVRAGAAGRSVAEVIEKSVLGLEPKVYGLLNHERRILKDITNEPLLHQINAAIESLEAKGYNGPYFVFHGYKFDLALNSDHGDSPFTQREAVRGLTRNRNDADGKIKHEKVVIDCVRMDHADDSIVVVQATPDVVRIVVGVDVTTVRWDDGYMTLAIIVPNIRTNMNGDVGIAHIR